MGDNYQEIDVQLRRRHNSARKMSQIILQQQRFPDYGDHVHPMQGSLQNQDAGQLVCSCLNKHGTQSPFWRSVWSNNDCFHFYPKQDRCGETKIRTTLDEREDNGGAPSPTILQQQQTSSAGFQGYRNVEAGVRALEADDPRTKALQERDQLYSTAAGSSGAPDALLVSKIKDPVRRARVSIIINQHRARSSLVNERLPSQELQKQSSLS